MKKAFFVCLSACFVYLFFNLNVSSSAQGDKSVVRINERLFIAQTNDIYINAEDYLGKTIVYEGIYKKLQTPDTDETFHCVIRYGPGCCANDGQAGFEVRWDGEWPQQDAWCEVSGTLEEYKVGEVSFLRLALTSLKVLKKRGAETVKT